MSTAGWFAIIRVQVTAGTEIPWTKPDDIDITQHPTLGDPEGFSSGHGIGLNVLFCDGSVRLMKKETNAQTVQAIFTTNGREVVGNF